MQGMRADPPSKHHLTQTGPAFVRFSADFSGGLPPSTQSPPKKRCGPYGGGG
jgi:hypothetical protein